MIFKQADPRDLIREARLTSLPTPLSLTRELADALDASLAREAKLREALRDADAYLADPDGNPIDAINFARAALASPEASEEA